MPTQSEPQEQTIRPEQPTPDEDQNLSGENADTEVNPGQIGEQTEVDLDTHKVRTFDGDTGSNQPQ